MAIAAALPTLSQVQALDTTYLREADDYWTRTADLWEEVFTEVHNRISSPGGTPWTGHAAAAEQERSATDLVKIRGAVYQLQEAAGIARQADG